MKHRMLILLLCLTLTLTGCGWLDGSYVSIKAHQEQRQETKAEALVAGNYQELTAVLESLISDGSESGVISVAAYPTDTLDRGIAAAIRYATESYPLGAYAVSEITYELGTNNGLPALAVSIAYRHSAAQIRAIRTVADKDAMVKAVTDALESYEPELVLRVRDYSTADFTQIVRAYAEEFPNLVMETPQVTASVYGQSREKVVELSFTYQNSREDLRKMQSQVQPVFASAALYVSGDGAENQKFSQLYAFLMERFSYQLETSITPAYSLLRHGVGDSRAFALVYAAMCRQAELEALTVTGTCAGEPRTWNIILDGGRYYHVDLLACYDAGGFRELTDDQMEGYVWDYSAYPACPAVPTPQATEATPAATQASEPMETTQPQETEPAETTEPTEPDATIAE